MEKKIVYVGHRGGKLENFVENTAPAYENGAKAGYKALETDIRVTKDKIFIASHDNTIERLTKYSKIKSNLDVNNNNYSEFKDLELSEYVRGTLVNDARICLFDEYLQICHKYKCIPIIELKWTNGIFSDNNDDSHYNYDNLDSLVQKVYNYQLENEAYIMTSMRGCLEYVRKNYPKMKLQWLCGANVKEYLNWCAINNINIDCEYIYCDQEVVDFAHEHNLLVNIWTLDDENLLQKYIDMGVDMVTTNYIKPR